MPDEHTFSVFIGVLIVVHLSNGLLIAKRLETTHPEFWDRLGRPSFLNWGIANSWRLGWAMLFSRSLVRLSDPKLSTMVWIARVIYGVILAAIAVWVIHYHRGHHSN